MTADPTLSAILSAEGPLFVEGQPLKPLKHLGTKQNSGGPIWVLGIRYTHLGGGFKYVLFSPLPGEMIQVLFSDGLKPPTRKLFDHLQLFHGIP